MTTPWGCGAFTVRIVKRIAAVLFVVLASCGGDKGDSTSATTASPSSSVFTTTTASPAASRFGHTAVSVAPHGEQGTLTDVRVGKHEGFTRVVFEFDDLPGYAVSPASPPFVQDGSGNEVSVQGNAFLAVRFESARAHDDEGKSSAPLSIASPGSDTVNEVRRIGDFEGVVHYVIGMHGEHAFAVDALTTRHLLVIDIAST